MKFRVFGMVLAGVLVAASLEAQDAQSAAASMKYSRETYAKLHMVAIATLDFGAGGASHFKYDRYPKGGPERVQAGDGEFARAKGKGWLRSNDWGETGQPVDAQVAKRLNNWVGLIDGLLNAAPTLEFVTKKIDDGREELIFKDKKTASGEAPRFIFGKYQNDKSENPPLLSEFSGPMQLGARVATVTVRFSYLVSVNIVEATEGGAAAKPPAPSAEPAKVSASGAAVRLLDGKFTIAVPADFVREPDNPKDPKTLAKFTREGGAWGSVLRGTHGLTPEKLPDYLKTRVAEYSKGFNWLPKDSPLTWLRKDIVTVDGRPWADWRFAPVKKGSKDFSHSPVYSRFLTTSYAGQLLEVSFTSNLDTTPELKREIDAIMDSVHLED
jgi:hypothetical protein